MREIRKPFACLHFIQSIFSNAIVRILHSSLHHLERYPNLCINKVKMETGECAMNEIFCHTVIVHYYQLQVCTYHCNRSSIVMLLSIPVSFVLTLYLHHLTAFVAIKDTLLPGTFFEDDIL